MTTPPPTEPPAAPPPVQLYTASAADAPAITALVNRAYRGNSGRQGWTTEADLIDGTRISTATLHELLADEDCTVLVGKSGKQLVACMELRCKGRQLYIGMLTVEPGLQGRRIGSLFMDAAEAHARQLGLDSLVMMVISVRHELIAWYQRRGFRATGETQAFGFVDASFGRPRRPLEFTVLEKRLGGDTGTVSAS